MSLPCFCGKTSVISGHMDKRHELIQRACATLGTREVDGPKSNPTILGWIREFLPWARDDSTTAWCAVWLAKLMRDCGLGIPGAPYRAKSWETWGVPVPPVDGYAGDVVVLKRGKNAYHVAILLKYSFDKIWVIGGNQSDAVTVATYPASSVISVRRLWGL